MAKFKNLANFFSDYPFLIHVLNKEYTMTCHDKISPTVPLRCVNDDRLSHGKNNEGFLHLYLKVQTIVNKICNCIFEYVVFVQDN